MIGFLRASDELKGATPGLTRSKPRLPRRYISDASTTVGLCGMSLHAGVLAYWSYAFTSGDLELGLHINQLEAIAAATTVATWPPGKDTHADMCVDNQAVEHSFRRGASRRDAVSDDASVRGRGGAAHQRRSDVVHHVDPIRGERAVRPRVARS